MRALHFDCTQCGRCCHGLRLTLSIDEALAWAAASPAGADTLELLTEALPWPDPAPPLPDDAAKLHDYGRSFAGHSGGVPLRIAASLVAAHAGACPHLLPDNRCGNYADRPRICRIYPLHRRPGVALDPAHRLCPPEAWHDAAPLLVAGDVPADPAARAILADHRSMARADALVLARATALLGIDHAALAHEGLAIHRFPPGVLPGVLRQAHTMPVSLAREWTVVSNRAATRTMLADLGCRIATAQLGSAYLGSFPDG